APLSHPGGYLFLLRPRQHLLRRRLRSVVTAHRATRRRTALSTKPAWPPQSCRASQTVSCAAKNIVTHHGSPREPFEDVMPHGGRGTTNSFAQLQHSHLCLASPVGGHARPSSAETLCVGDEGAIRDDLTRARGADLALLSRRAVAPRYHRPPIARTS